MTFAVQTRLSESPLVESVTHGQTIAGGTAIRPAETRWHMIVSRVQDQPRFLIVGPWSASGPLDYGAGADILWIRFRLGVFMPHLPVRSLLNAETPLPEAAGESFWLKSAAWQFPTAHNVDTFVARLAREQVLIRDPVIDAALNGELRREDYSPRTLRHRFLQATGLSEGHIAQVERAQKAAALLRHGIPILDVVEEAGYFDQPHLTRSLKQYIGHTPAQIQRAVT